MRAASPCGLFAVVGQARADRRISATEESSMLAATLTRWAMQRSLARMPRPVLSA
jgi:hypothetical protein